MTNTNTPLRRVMYCITSRSGQFLINLAADGPVFSPMAAEALHASMAWMESTTAANKLRTVRQQFPGIALGLGLMEMESTGPANWRITGVQCFHPPLHNTSDTLIA